MVVCAAVYAELLAHPLVNQHSVNQHFVDEFLAETVPPWISTWNNRCGEPPLGAPPCLGRRLPEAMAD